MQGNKYTQGEGKVKKVRKFENLKSSKFETKIQKNGKLKISKKFLKIKKSSNFF
jgi:hypothetical protein